MVDTIVKAAVKDELGGMNVSADFYDALDEEVSDLLEDAARRAQDNDRKTVQARDLEDATTAQRLSEPLSLVLACSQKPVCSVITTIGPSRPR